MRPKSKIERVDSLIDHLWQHGYLTLSRKFGKYLPAPPRMGEYEIDAVARYKKKIALGITASDEDLNDPTFITKLDFLANYQARFPQHRITLFLGVPYNSIVKASLLISSLDIQTQKHIKVVALTETAAQ
jgi:hypothetical protein